MESSEGKKTSYKAVLGTDSASSEFEVTSQDCGEKAGIKYECVSINPLATEDFETKTLQVTYKEEERQQGNLKYTTVAVYESPSEVADSSTISKIVTLQEHNACTANANLEVSGASEQMQVFASDPEALNLLKFAQAKNKSSAASSQVQNDDDDLNDECEMFASDPEALKYVKLMRKNQPATQQMQTQSQTVSSATAGVCGSDEDALKFIKLAPASSQLTAETDELNCTGAASPDESPEIFISDPEVLKFIKFSLPPSMTTSKHKPQQHSDNAEPATPPPTPAEEDEGDEENVEQPVGYACSSEPNINEPSAENAIFCKSAAAETQHAEGETIAESTVTLKDDKNYTVTVSGQSLASGLLKKVISVNGDGSQSMTEADVDKLQVSVEEKVNKDGTVEKFVAIE